MNNYLDAKISFSESWIRAYKKTLKIYVGILAISISIAALDIWAKSWFGAGCMVMNITWFIFAIIENYFDYKHEKETLKFYQQQDFKDTQDRMFESYHRSTQHYEALIKQMTPDNSKEKK